MEQELLTLTIPGADGTPQVIQAPSGIPTGGLRGDGSGILGFGISLFLIVCVLLALGYLVYGGFSWIVSQGDKTKLEESRRTIIYAIIGLIVAFLSFFVIALVGGFFGIDLLNLSF